MKHLPYKHHRFTLISGVLPKKKPNR